MNDNNTIGRVRYSCKFPNCSVKYYSPIHRESYKNKRFYRFPKNGVLERHWKDVCQIGQSVIASNFFVCEDHFDIKDFTDSNMQLNPGAVPKYPDEITKHSGTEVEPPSDLLDVAINEATFISDCSSSRPDKYAFLNENHAEVFTNSDPSQMGNSRKLTMLNIDQLITYNLLNLKSLLKDEKFILKKLCLLYDDGKFKYTCERLRFVSNEFICSRLENTPPVTIKQWTEDDNLLALSLYNRNEKFYKYLCAFFHLPSAKVLAQILYKIPFKTGIRAGDMLNQIQIKSSLLSAGNRTCVLLMVETPLTKGLQYDDHYQKFYGHVDMGHFGRSAKSADRALIFMARGLRRNWTQVVGYYFCDGPFDSINLEDIIISTIQMSQQSWKVVALVCEQNMTNIRTLKLICSKLSGTSNYAHFIVNNKQVNVVFDARRLLTQTMTALRNCNVKYDTEMEKTAKFEHIERAYNLDQSTRIFKQVRALKDQYFDPKNKSNETEVEAAAVIFSHSVAACIETFVTCGDLPAEAMHTAEFVKVIDMMFESLNGSERKAPSHKKFDCALSVGSPHLNLWTPLLTQMSKWTLSKITGGNATDCYTFYSFIKGWRATLESLYYIWNDLRHTGHFNYLSLKRCNLEPLENLLKKISQYGTRGKSPTCRQFENALKTELLLGTEDPWTSDGCCNLISIRELIKDVPEDPNSCEGASQTFFDDLDFVSIGNLSSHEQAAYLSGYLLQKMDIPNCSACRCEVFAEWVINNDEIVSLKEYDTDTYPLFASDNVIRIVDRILGLTQVFMEKNREKMGLEDLFLSTCRNELESFKFCEVHSTNEELIRLCIKLGFHRYVHSL